MTVTEMKRTAVVVAILTLFAFVDSASSADTKDEPYRYNVCNGLTNQLLYHAASMAIASREGYKSIEIPNSFIVNGAQSSTTAVLPTKENSVELNLVLDTEWLRQTLESELGLEVRFVKNVNSMECAGMGAVQQADPDTVLSLLETAFRPSNTIQEVVASIRDHLPSDKQGVCLHYRNGQDWQDHCEKWSQIDDGIYRGNCLESEPLADALQHRGIDDENKFVYYCGDSDEAPADLRNKATVVSRSQVIPQASLDAVHNLASIKDFENNSIRDIWSWIDFNVCRDMNGGFVGNSVSTFSALQIALRRGQNTYWYNSRGIPLAQVWPSTTAFPMPIVYTYTEQSEGAGKELLKTSITSVRQHMMNSPIHILYHGKQDVEFIRWLEERNVIRHEHTPTWQAEIERMRQHGDAAVSHLFQHAGNYFGTWQRIDLPLYLDTEYALLLDADTVLHRPLSLKDFGQDITPTLALSSEIDLTRNDPVNAGVMLLNIPFMRKTHDAFVKFVSSHVESGPNSFDNAFPSDQGAYAEFFKDDVTFLSRCFNFKPYYRISSDLDREQCGDEPYIVHFHGAKPHDYLKHVLGEPCPAAVRPMCNKALSLPSLCRSFEWFAQAAAAAAEEEVNPYCQATFGDATDAEFCTDLLDALKEGEGCQNIAMVIRNVMKGDGEEEQKPWAIAAAQRLLQQSSPSMMPSVMPSIGPSAPAGCKAAMKSCTSPTECCGMAGCYGKGEGMSKCATCAKMSQNCSKDKECCKFKQGKEKCISGLCSSKCTRPGKNCASKTDCCSSKCKMGTCK